MSAVEQSEEPPVRFSPPEEALERARPVPPGKPVIVGGVRDDQGAAFQQVPTQT